MYSLVNSFIHWILHLQKYIHLFFSHLSSLPLFIYSFFNSYFHYPSRYSIIHSSIHPSFHSPSIHFIHLLLNLFREQLESLCEQDIISFYKRPTLEREILWEKRFYLRYFFYIDVETFCTLYFVVLKSAFLKIICVFPFFFIWFLNFFNFMFRLSFFFLEVENFCLF